MGNGEIDRLTISQLIERYRLARSAVYKRIEALGIEAKKIGGKAFYSNDQVKLLDELHDFIQRGGNTAQFIEMRGIPSEEPFSDESTGLTTGQSDLLNLMNRMLPWLKPSEPEPDPLAYFEKLEQACRNQWLLSTSEVANLLGMSVTEIQRYGDRFYEAGFAFTRSGYRAGGELAWKVSKR
ncbi:MAG: hypothetical protein HC781_23110 [Leptolyngbyaceae cyanobacterium CSU_1_4]|nr:hypothetical protein [Leptolyngbyaceae cyanobacterium CSU_1_4]